MCKEAKRLTPFKPKKLTKKEKLKLQAGMLVANRIDVRSANAEGLARYQAKRGSGAWEHQNFVENFGYQDECETA